ncbi:MAG: hypothetical protein ACYS0H_26510, partial [Planctomycetota bacterium]
TFKELSAKHGAPANDNPAFKSKDAPSVDQQRAQPENTPAEIARMAWRRLRRRYRQGHQPCVIR